MRLTRTADLWWKTAVVYCLDVETFRDGDGDGTGDFHGLAQQVDYLDRLGVTCIWLMPFFPTPDRDDGYDIVDFYNVDPRLGTLGDFVEFTRTARDRGMRVIADLVVNHTSDRHPWFEDARSSRDSPYRDWYVWQDEPPADGPKGVVFPDEEDGLWSRDEASGQYYLHRFYRHQPDLNVANPDVRAEIARVMGFWMELGLSGFRVDAVPFLLETSGQDDAAALPDPHDYLADLRRFMTRRNGESVLLGEVNLPYPDTMRYFGDGGGDELTMCFDFIGMQHMYLSLARRDARPLASALRERPAPPKDAHWATFVRNHDELTLDRLTEDERNEVFDAFGPEETMRIYGRGLRRRLPPILGGDERHVKMVYSLLFSLPGTPVLYYGEEIGMAEDLRNEDRLAMRSPMQWRPGPRAGFSTADPGRYPAPVVEGQYGPDRVSVSAQLRDPGSLLSWIGLLAQRYRECPELAWGEYRILDTGVPQVLAHRCDTGDGLDGDVHDGTVIALHNFAPDATEVELELDGMAGDCVLTDLLVDGGTAVSADGTAKIALDGYGCRWFRATRGPD
ncbi:alpha-amylase family protein [Allonocardiopsis opalescens]|uniref:Maltose alpha-D-glucosyltransferase/alpha-amylase n=1 Tax=Allonocardiopsis opalescens TaxID=1144618 RepID=A0A2T0Q7R9_9ACTN|nr:alpha-amylase family protein [Allonocardiopsis opalescens]PRX99783.1 maltose alpha-D-glucosyltransferase/alpha-amylase [Allonocardiopsis opalescens]